MPLDRLTTALAAHVAELEEKGTAKGEEAVVTAVRAPSGTRGPRVLLEGGGQLRAHPVQKRDDVDQEVAHRLELGIGERSDL